MTASVDTATAAREKVIFTYWLYPAIGIPFVILGWWGGFGAAFQSGAASAFMCGAIIAALGECLFENWKDGFTRFKAMVKTPGKDRAAAIFAVVLATTFFFLNMYFAVADKKVPHPAVDWIQVTVFIVTAVFLPQARFAFTGTKPPTPGELAQSGWNYGYGLGSKLGRPKGAHGGPPVPEVGAGVLPLPAEVQGDAPVPPSTEP
jgi:hypothetical protein